MRERGLSSCEMSCSSRVASSVLVPARSLIPAALETWTWELPSWVLSRRRAVLAALEEESKQGSSAVDLFCAYVSFSKVTVAL